ncbi:MAG: hypothetical protein ABXS91_08725 [Sulfurimonas sp.]
MGKKICKKCGEEKSVIEFYVKKKAKDGYHATCKECQKAQKRKAYQVDKEVERKGKKAINPYFLTRHNPGSDYYKTKKRA